MFKHKQANFHNFGLNPMKKTGELCGKITSVFGSSGT